MFRFFNPVEFFLKKNVEIRGNVFQEFLENTPTLKNLFLTKCQTIEKQYFLGAFSKVTSMEKLVLDFCGNIDNDVAVLLGNNHKLNFLRFFTL